MYKKRRRFFNNIKRKKKEHEAIAAFLKSTLGVQGYYAAEPIKLR